MTSHQQYKSSPREYVKFLDYKPIPQIRECLLPLMASSSTHKQSFPHRLPIIISPHIHACISFYLDFIALKFHMLSFYFNDILLNSLQLYLLNNESKFVSCKPNVLNFDQQFLKVKENRLGNIWVQCMW